ncbi:ABC transporter ATP-binding protein [Gelidibacter salicanalis]|uniref:ABC transporter ATP-binding protein n=1 Tax=Gelidibacter salicanalis TaxID=291193 RepID=A0A5C7AB98_9FLAO|nr:ABC transporter ATP-binding protein [Gelidibacter salicanalis]TXE05838.1 ABC transporter ATP-binding protein [Gelidibacter salicanalis]
MIILKAENISKQYRLGTVGTGTISHDLNRWWHKVRGKEDPFLKVGDSNDRSTKGTSEYVWALQDINFEVRRGEVLGIIGKNGAGKSTLLKILSRVTSPTTGEIKTKGRIASLLEVGTGFHPEMTGRENIYLNGAILGMTKKEIHSKMDEIISFSGCERYIDTPVKRYSSGMTVRLAFAVAAHLEPDILVIDEVLAVGDAEFQKKAIGKMQDISQGDGRTVLFVSHNMAAVKSLCSRAIVLEHGKTVFEGATDNAISYYLNSKEDIFNIAKISDRKGSGLVKLIDVAIYGSQRNRNPQSGSPFHITFTLENLHKKLNSQLDFDLRIDDGIGQRIAWISNTLLTNDTQEIINTVTFKVSKLNLNKGVYHVTTHISIDKVVADWIQNAFSFEVIEGDYHGSGKLVPQNQSRVLLDFEVDYNL